MAKWLTTGAPEIDLSAYDIKRFNRHLVHNRVWCQERCREAYARNYGIIYQCDEPLTARNETFSDALYDILKSKGCVYRERHGIQCPDWFDLTPQRLTTEEYIDLDNTYDWSEDSRQWMAVKHECESSHERAIVVNLSSMAKYLVRGENAMKVIDSLSPTDVKSMPNNSTILTYLLNKRGGIIAEIIVTKINDSEFYITCAEVSTNHVFVNLCDVINDENIGNIEIVDLSKDIGILSLNGPKSTEILETSFDISLNDFREGSHRKIKINVSIE
ncbi:unnamed protein product [Medioppia subpectinata]|uniref:Uncharacterized protein n=1 Tax=Medioppia subpectinata TaxID=1979941 RepID=A0A7R9QJA7_9ACAR|nr:unnamed protein product [Medioppia subpectinata]CAG2121261.1 unnamed protein product [Medioppia subpectinata]